MVTIHTAIGTIVSAPVVSEHRSTLAGRQPARDATTPEITAATRAAITHTAIRSRTIGTSSEGERKSATSGSKGSTTKQTTSRIAVRMSELSLHRPHKSLTHSPVVSGYSGETSRAGGRRRRRYLKPGTRHRNATRRLYDRRVTDADIVFLERALELAGEALGVAHPKPTVGAVVVRDGAIVGEGVTEARGRHGEVVAFAAAGERARGAAVYVTMEPCNHHGSTPPCTDALLEAGVARVVVGQLDPNPTVEGGGLARLRTAGVEVVLAEGEIAFRCRQQLEEWRTWITQGRPFVTYKVAVTLDGRVTVPGERWVTGEASRRLVHLLRAASDAVAVGMGTVRWDDPRLDARDVPTPRGQPRRIAFGRGPLPAGSELELRSGPLREELEALAADGVQSLLLEGGPTLAAAFLEQDLVDKLLVFVAPKLSGEGAGMVAGLPGKLALTRLEARSIGEDVLLQGYLHRP
jgi:diaminohydroxyphosphoribosylaminopyrimidine deaminase/5-amino-6-(5-phosphoribosylamino)uracil reductase